MGEHTIRERADDAEMRSFVKALLEDVRALERMLEGGQIETGMRRIGAEQEVFLIGPSYSPTNTALAILSELTEGSYATELGLFNLELNLTPLELGGTCLSRMHRELDEGLERMRRAAEPMDTRILMCGILPTLSKRHLGLEWMTPNPRYKQLNDMMCRLRGGEFMTLIKGVDELQATHDNVMLEACNTSFQVHFQVGPEEFAPLYNLAQVVTAPVLAAAVNSPVLLQHRLWHETRVALFQQSLDTRSEVHTKRGGRQRVSFGDRWVDRSVIEIFREDIARFRALIAVETGESPLEVLDRGEIPELNALRLHNGTIYRWNRPCYGVQDGVAHLRIENRVLPAGPTVIDEMANAAFFYGLMCGLDLEFGDVTQAMSFDDAKANFLAAARYGLQARFRWVGGMGSAADELILEQLLPLAHQGLRARGLDAQDIDLYLGVIEQRVGSGRTGAQWAFDSLAKMGTAQSVGERHRSLTVAMHERQRTGKPVHTWDLVSDGSVGDERNNYQTVEEFMTTDIFTVQPGDVVDLAASLMEWEHIRFVPVEDEDGKLVGLVTYRELMRVLARGGSRDSVAVRDIMKRELITASPTDSAVGAMQTMRKHKVGCLPVVRDGKLVGILTEHDLMRSAGGRLESWLRGG